MNTNIIELETLKQLDIMNKENKARPSLMLPKHFDGNLVVTNSYMAIKVADEKYKEDGRTDYPNNAVNLFNDDPIEWIELKQVDMKSLKEIAATFKRLKEDNIIIVFEEDYFYIEGYSNKVKINLPYKQVILSGDIIYKNIMVNPKYIEQILSYYIKLKATNIKIEWNGKIAPIQITSGNIQYLVAQIRTPRKKEDK